MPERGIFRASADKLAGLAVGTATRLAAGAAADATSDRDMLENFCISSLLNGIISSFSYFRRNYYIQLGL